MNKVLLTVFIWLLCNCVYAQSLKQLDSLEQILETNISDKEKVDTYCKISGLFADSSDSAKVFQYAYQAIDLAHEIDYSKGVVDAYYHIGWTYMTNRVYDKSYQFFDQQLEMAEKTDYIKGQANALRGIALLKHRQLAYDTAFQLQQKALVLYQKASDKKGEMLCHLNMARIMYRQKKFEKAIAYGRESLKLAKELKDLKHESLSKNYIVASYQHTGRYQNAIEICLEQVVDCEKEGNKFCLIDTYNQIGILFFEQENYAKAIEYYLMSLKVSKELKDIETTIIVLNNIGEAHLKQKKYTDALHYLEEAIAYNKDFADKSNLCYTYPYIGKIYLEKGKDKLALDYLQKGLKFSTQFEDTHQIGVSHQYKGEFYLKKKQYNKAVTEFEKANQQLKKSKTYLAAVRDITGLLADTYKKSGKYKQAYQQYVVYAALKDSIHNRGIQKKLIQMESALKFQKEKDSIQFAQEKERLIFEQEAEKQQSTQRNMLIVLGLVSLLVIVLFIFFMEKHKNNRKLEDTNAQLTDSNEELNVLYNSLNESLVVSEARRQQIQDSINYAQRIQKAMLPSEKRLDDSLPDHFVMFRPRDSVSGDFYWLGDMLADNDKVIITAVDCTGHGVPGAFMSMIGNDLLNYIINWKHITDAGDILTHLHQKVREVLNQKETSNRDGMDISLVVWDKKRNCLEFAGAKNPIVYIQNGELHQIKGDRMPIGGEQREVERVFTKHEITLDSPVTFYIFSDGYQDQFGGMQNKKFMSKRFRQLLFDIHKKPMAEQQEHLNKVFEDWMGKDHNQIDDVLVIGARLGSEAY